MSLAGDTIPGIAEAGCDEAGRGCLAGPVFAAAVILPAGFDHPKLNDSKKLDAATRDELRAYIEKNALHWAVASATPDEIDEINILKASILSMHRALDKLNVIPGSLIIDGNRFRPWKGVPFKCMIKGDARFRSIAAASILAKTHRDEFMKDLHRQFPQYKWIENKGYPTAAHRQALKVFGKTPFHRKSFRLLEDQLSMDI